MQKKFWIFVLSSFLSTVSLHYACGQNEQAAPAERVDVSVTGRLSWDQESSEKPLILLDRMGQTYHIIGSLKTELADALVKYGSDNLVIVEGTRDAATHNVCIRKQTIDREKKVHLTVSCIPYFDLDVSRIVEQKTSPEKMPPPLRNAELEAGERLQALQQGPGLNTKKVLIEISGKITALNLRSPIRSMEVAYRDKDNQPLTRILFITDATKIAKAAGGAAGEPIYITPEGLQAGQTVKASVAFNEDFGTNEAMFVTVSTESNSGK